MSSTKPAGGAEPTAPSLPPNVSIFSPKNSSTTQALLATADDTTSSPAIFTRLAVSASTTPTKLTEALESLSPTIDRSSIKQEFYVRHGNAVLVFDSAATSSSGGDRKDDEEAAVKDLHHEHVRAVCLAFKDRDIGLDIAGCVFDAPEAVRAGFQFDKLSDGAVMVVDLMHDDGDSDDDDDDEANLENLLAGAEVIS